MNKPTYETLSVNCDDAGVVRIVIDVRGRPINIINADVMRDLDAAITEIEQRDDIKLVVFKSGKESGFFAGADVSVIESILNKGDAEQLLLTGQRLFARIENLPVPTLTEIHGPCLGGGLELALACDYRIARDNSSTKIGLPEIKLGLIPGWGGTQRLPRCVGLKNALKMILKGLHLSAREAASIGLVDKAVEPDQWRDELIATIAQLTTGNKVGGTTAIRRTVTNRLQGNEFVRKQIIAVTEQSIAKQAEHFPALQSAIRAISESYRTDQRGYETERAEFKKLLFTPTCRNLLRLFFSRERARHLKTWAPNHSVAIHQEPIRSIGVIGGGVMGAGIAHNAAMRGFPSVIKEVNSRTVEAANSRVDSLVKSYAKHKQLDPLQTEKLRSSIMVSENIADTTKADCVIEAIIERMEVKKSVLREIEDNVSNSAIIATNTSALSVTEMATVLRQPSRFAGLHFFNPVERMELVEVVRGKETSDATIAKLVSFVKALGKTPIVTQDSPGFLVNRILFPYLGEAVLMVQQGFDVKTIDAEMKAFGMPMGPLRLLDKVGLDVALHVAGTLSATMSAAGTVSDILGNLVGRGDLGSKSGSGFYLYKGKRAIPRSGRKLVSYFVQPPASIDFIEDGLTDIQRRLAYPMLLEATRCLSERVVDQEWAIDLAMVLGTGFAPQLGGPMQVISQIGRTHFQANLARLALQLGERFEDIDGAISVAADNPPLLRQGNSHES
ncbi:3-hydroxyacyl-CoA dehydrogenase NAD-binding domain-containing protein [Stieleria sp. JC731]|uniref:3-hydroxyacyl-CoA dehydrogenase NAD-binding domain-containing protein n=1 Tax=Pirellulaceae TaxID=2691357 RepID=UPI001E2C545A|nr:3-hydroxyacyl-CoA dehydrogenase NAD-binding domain-containing protein [Stieleria sp. JC731]MCC9602032.1 3-hydroxyacyl-CoA dehydrogenase NAD-binding domain-containing protein [Stieleria sp. JC731]